MEKCRRIENPQLPEPMIQHIQSYLNCKEAARTTVLSKSWLAAWLTRPALVFDERDFENRDPDAFEEFAVKSIQRHQAFNLKIDRFALLTHTCRSVMFRPLACELIAAAVKMGATHLDIELRHPAFLPQEVLNSKTLLRLSVKECEIEGSVACPMLKSLCLENVVLVNDDLISDIISCCVSIEEISLSNPIILMPGETSFANPKYLKSRKVSLSGMKNPYELHKLKRLYLEKVNVDNSFFEDFGSRSPCLNDLSLVNCGGFKVINISSASLQRISLVQSKAVKADFDVPNLAHFSYSGKSIPSLSIEAKKWDSSISIKCNRSHTYLWYLRLLKLLTQLSQSRISLSLSFAFDLRWSAFDDEKDFELSSQPLAVENLAIEAPVSSSHDRFLAGLFWICHPKFLTLYWLPRDYCKEWMENNESLNHVCEHLSQEVIKIYDRDTSMFGRFDIEEVNVEVYEEVLTEWRPLLLKKPLDALIAPPNKRKVCFGLKWKKGIAWARM